jgi:hypothetical protein
MSIRRGGVRDANYGMLAVAQWTRTRLKGEGKDSGRGKRFASRMEHRSQAKESGNEAGRRHLGF